jgi:glycosyltransferase involved in cell wall biosynthesis
MKLLLFANTDWYIYNFRRSLALGAKAAGHDVLLVSPDGPYGQKLTELGIRWIPAPMQRRSLNPLRELALCFWLWRLVRTERVDVVHSFTIKCAVYGGLAARFAGAARVNSVAGMGYVFIGDESLARKLRPIVWALLRVALAGVRTRLILQNLDDITIFEKSGIASGMQIRLIPGSGVDCGRFQPPAEGERSGPLRVVLAARMLWDKGVREFVEAARMLKLQGRPLRFQLAGGPDPGNPASIPESVLRDWQASGLVDWLGHVDDMPALLASADIVVLPSYREGLPKSLIEAAACARPLVTTDVPGCREVVTDGINGLIVPVRDASALAQAIARLQDEPSFARRLGEAARVKALAEYDERRIVPRILGVYSELLGDSRCTELAWQGGGRKDGLRSEPNKQNSD